MCTRVGTSDVGIFGWSLVEDESFCDLWTHHQENGKVPPSLYIVESHEGAFCLANRSIGRKGWISACARQGVLMRHISSCRHQIYNVAPVAKDECSENIELRMHSCLSSSFW